MAEKKIIDEAVEEHDSIVSKILLLANNPRVFRILGYSFAILLFIFLVVAILSFTKIIPQNMSKNIPWIGRIVRKSEIIEKSQSKNAVTSYKLNSKTIYPKYTRSLRKDDFDAISGKKTSTFTKTPEGVVMRRKFYEGKSVGEIYVKEYLSMSIVNKNEYLNAYERAETIASRLKSILLVTDNVKDIKPKVVNGDVTIDHKGTLIAKVTKLDAAASNITPVQQAIAWANNFRIAMGETDLLKSNDVETVSKEKIEKAKEEVRKEEEAKRKKLEAEKKVLEEKQKKLEAEKEAQQDAAKLKKLKKIVKAYESMSAEDAVNILKNMNEREVSEILSLMQDRKLSKILSAMEPVRAARLSRRLTKSK